MENCKKYPNMGFGLGLRKEHYHDVISSLSNVGQAETQSGSDVDWFEILTENYLVAGGKPLYFLDKIAEYYPLAMHGVSMNIGNTGSLDKEYLKQVKSLKNRINAYWLSDHLCWTGTNGTNAHDLLPLPYTEEALQHVVERIQQVQDFMGSRILIENVSSYVSYKQSEMKEWEFLSEIAQRADCLLLLDINNIYVSAVNHEFDPVEYLLSVPKDRVQQFHLAGHSDYGDYIIDTHDMPVCDAVWSLYAMAVEHFGEVTFMIERDDNIPSFEILLKELRLAREISQEVNQSAYDVAGIEKILLKNQQPEVLQSCSQNNKLML